MIAVEMGVSSAVTKFADNMRLFRRMKTKGDCEELQDALSKLGSGQQCSK